MVYLIIAVGLWVLLFAHNNKRLKDLEDIIIGDGSDKSNLGNRVKVLESKMNVLLGYDGVFRNNS